MMCFFSNIIPVGIDCSVIYRSTPTYSRCPDCTSYECRCGLLHMFACLECAKLRMHCTCSAKTLLISILSGEISTCSLHCKLFIAIIFCDVICHILTKFDIFRHTCSYFECTIDSFVEYGFFFVAYIYVEIGFSSGLSHCGIFMLGGFFILLLCFQRCGAIHVC